MKCQFVISTSSGKMDCMIGSESALRGSFQEAVGPILALAQCFGILPVIGIKSNTSYGLKFTWKSFRTIYSIITFFCAATYATFITYMTLTKTITFNSIVLWTFFSTSSYAVCDFILLARKWPTLMQHWEFVEAILPPFQSLQQKMRLASKVKWTSLIVLSFALAEHTLNAVSTVMRAIKSNENALEFLFQTDVPYIYTFIELNWWNAIIGTWLNVVVTFAWSFMDLFVMIVSIGLTAQFHQINTDLQQMKGQRTSERYWLLRRIQYRKVVQLTAAVDQSISKIVFVTLGNNLFFICVQIVKTIKPMPPIASLIYFWFSLTFLIVRTLAVSLLASYIHDESKKPIEVLRAIPRESWCTDAWRFTEEVTNQTVALSGMKFFFLTRQIILSVAATIATYELVLFQFNTDT